MSLYARADQRSGAGCIVGRLAEREGFEPSEELPPHMISSHADSASLASLRGRANGHYKVRPARAFRGEKRYLGLTSPSEAYR